MIQIDLPDGPASRLVRGLAACLSSVTEVPLVELPTLEDVPVAHALGAWKSWLAGRGSGLVPIADARSFEWAGWWIGVVDGSESPCRRPAAAGGGAGFRLTARRGSQPAGPPIAWPRHRGPRHQQRLRSGVARPSAPRGTGRPTVDGRRGAARRRTPGRSAHAAGPARPRHRRPRPWNTCSDLSSRNTRLW